MLTALAMSTVLVLATIFLHFAALKALAERINDTNRPLTRPLISVLLVLFATHLTEVMMFAAGFQVLDWVGAGFVSPTGSQTHLDFFDLFYFSISSYTTLGVGDIVPHGGVRLLAGIEALNGLLLIAWSASFTYLMMERLWSGDKQDG